MNKKVNGLLVKAAMAGILGAMVAPGLAQADHHEKGHCMGANGCKGKSACNTANNACAGQNGCKGKGFLDSTKGECEKLSKKDKASYKFESTEAPAEKK